MGKSVDYLRQSLPEFRIEQKGNDVRIFTMDGEWGLKIILNKATARNLGALPSLIRQSFQRAEVTVANGQVLD